MPLITNQKYFPSAQPTGRPVLLLCGFGGKIWQVKRLIKTLNKAGYDITALDFSKDVLSKGDPQLLLQLVNDVVAFAERQAKQVQKPILLVGVSLGALISLNILRRSNLFQTGVLITGGDIAKIAQKLYPKVWPQTYAELAKTWESVNMYTDPQLLTGKRSLFVLHDSNKLIDVGDVRAEITRQRQAGNDVALVERKTFDHVGTIIEETVLFPRRTLEYIEQIEQVV